jgi:uncharacterized membrane protein
MVINEGLFCVKYLFVLAVFIAFLFVKNETFIEYSAASKYISIVFMILQVAVALISRLSSSTFSTWRESSWSAGTTRDRLPAHACSSS